MDISFKITIFLFQQKNCWPGVLAPGTHFLVKIQRISTKTLQFQVIVYKKSVCITFACLFVCLFVCLSVCWNCTQETVCMRMLN